MEVSGQGNLWAGCHNIYHIIPACATAGRLLCKRAQALVGEIVGAKLVF